jgi:hypothetical protein
MAGEKCGVIIVCQVSRFSLGQGIQYSLRHRDSVVILFNIGTPFGSELQPQLLIGQQLLKLLLDILGVNLPDWAQ